jgi:MATE family multidrug resistance protein
MTLLVVLTRDLLPLVFLGTGAPGAADTIALAAALLTLGATFFVADGVQTVAAGALRGLNDTRVPLLFAAASFWAVGFVLCYALAFPLGLGARGIWIGFTVGLVVYALLLVWRFHLLTQRNYLPALAEAR